jgi:hypothetical protein
MDDYDATVPVNDAQRIGVEAMRRLRSWSVCAVEPGLTDAEFDDIEARYGFQFADDHRAFLAAGLPVNRSLPAMLPEVSYTHPAPWPDWRAADVATLRKMLDWPVEGVLFDVEHNGHWRHDWGASPADSAARVDAARRFLSVVPVLVPVYGHRYLPAGAGTSGHPVLSMWQTDIIYYGADLADYIDREFRPDETRWADGRDLQATVEFWRDYL